MLVFLALVCLLAGFAHGALGFGFPLVATPLVALVIDMKSAITLLAPVTLVLVVISALRGGRLGDLVRRFWFCRSAIALGAWLGTKVLLAAPPEPFLLVLALVLLFYLNLDRLGRGESALVQRLRAPFGFAFAFVAGVSEAIANVAGPILFVYFMLLGAAPSQMVQTLNMCFTVGKGSQVATLAAAGALNAATWARGGGPDRARGGGARRRHARARSHRRADLPRLAAQGAVGDGGAAHRCSSRAACSPPSRCSLPSPSTARRAALGLVDEEPTSTRATPTATRRCTARWRPACARLTRALLARRRGSAGAHQERRDRAAPRGAASRAGFHRSSARGEAPIRACRTPTASRRCTGRRSAGTSWWRSACSRAAPMRA